MLFSPFRAVPLSEYEPRRAERALALFGFIGTLLIGPLAPLLVYLIGFHCRWVRRQAASSINFFCTLALLLLMLAVAMVLFTLFDFAKLAFAAMSAGFILVLLAVIVAFIGAKKSFDGELCEPLTIHRFIR